MPRLSIVIPCLGGAADFDVTLVSVLQNRPADCEVLVVHTEPYDDPYKLRGEVRFVHGEGGSISELLNHVIDLALGEIVHIVACGLEVAEGWTGPALAHFDDPEVAAVSPVVYQADRETIESAGIHWSLGGSRRLVTDRRIVSPGSGRLRARVHGPALSAAFYRRDVLAALGKLEAELGDELADVSAALDIRSLGRLHVCEPGSQLVRASHRSTASRADFSTGRAAERLFWRSALRSGLVLSLVLHAFVIASEIVRTGLGSIGSLAGRTLGWLEFGAITRHEQRLSAANDRLQELAELRTAVRKPAKAAATHRRAA